VNDDWYKQIPWPGALADLILLLHFLIVLFVVLGQILILLGWQRGWQWPRVLWFRLSHLATIAFVVVQTWLGRLCPLTIWEQQLRAAAGQPIHQQSFVEFWLSRILFFDLPWWAFTLTYTAFGMLVLLSWWKYPPRYRRA
jgi:hypothetical protein